MSANSRRLTWVLVTWAAYVGTWPLGHGSFFNDVYAVMAFGPLMMGAWFFGFRSAIVAVLGFIPLQMALYLANGHAPGWDALAGPEGAAGFAVMILVTCFVGWASDCNHRLQHSLAAKADLVAVVSHEVRTPLTGVVGMSRELQQSWPTLNDEIKQELVDLIAQSADDMSSIVEDLLTAASAEQGKLVIHPGVTDLSEVAGAVVEQLGAVVSIGGQALAWADPGRVRQVIRNLVVNACRYGGPEISLRAGADGTQAFIDVSDSGEGVPVEKLPSLFVPHSSDLRHPDSHGLGLALSHQLAILMGGSLSYRRVGEQTVFRFSLPRAVIPAPVTPVQVRVGR